MHDPKSTLDIPRLEQLIALKCSGSLAPGDCQELEHMLAESSEARSIYWGHLSIHAGLSWLYRGKRECDNRLAELESEQVASPENIVAQRNPVTAFHWTRWLPLTIATMLLIAMWVGGWRNNSQEQPVPHERTAKVANRGDLLGSLAPLSVDCQWSFGTPGEKNRQEFRSFDTLWLNQGAAELRLMNGTVVQLEAPLILEMVSIGRARVLRGRVTVSVSEGAQGFTVETSAAKIIDHGTTFSVDVADTRNTDVVVFQGEVDVNVMQHCSEAVRGRYRINQKAANRRGCPRRGGRYAESDRERPADGLFGKSHLSLCRERSPRQYCP